VFIIVEFSGKQFRFAAATEFSRRKLGFIAAAAAAYLASSTEPRGVSWLVVQVPLPSGSRPEDSGWREVGKNN
jgi:hypothetical protein